MNIMGGRLPFYDGEGSFGHVRTHAARAKGKDYKEPKAHPPQAFCFPAVL